MATKMKKKYTNRLYKCLYCDNRYNRVDLISHLVDEHEDEIPQGYTATRVVYDYINKKPAGYNGKCTECGGPTRWDENKGRYDRQCSKKACHESYIKKFEENMLKKKGVKRISQTEEGQKKMLANRKISGYYTFRDGVKKPYCGTYELKALEFMDKVMEINSYDILCPGPILEYQFEGKTHMYITDFYYQPYNLVIEVKDGGDNPNKRVMPEYRAKQIAKEEFIIKNTDYNYIRLTDNKLFQLISVFADIKMQLIDNSNDRVIHVNESVEQLDPIHEFMNALTTGYIPGVNDCDAYIVNYQQNNVFSNPRPAWNPKYAVSNTRSMKNLIGIDDEGKVNKLKDTDNLVGHFFKLHISKEELENKLKGKMNTPMTESEFYEYITGDKLLFETQIYYTFESVESVEEYNEKLNEKVIDFVTEKEETETDKFVDKVVNEIYEEINNG